MVNLFSNIKTERFTFTAVIIYLLATSACAVMKKQGISERIINLKKQNAPLVMITVSAGSIYLEKDDVYKILDKELDKKLNNQLKSDKKELLKLLNDDLTKYQITENDVANFSGILSIVDKLLKKGEADIVTSSGEKVDKIKLKEMHGLYGSYTRSYGFLDETEVIMTYAELGE